MENVEIFFDKKPTSIVLLLRLSFLYTNKLANETFNYNFLNISEDENHMADAMAKEARYKLIHYAISWNKLLFFYNLLF